MRDDNQLLVVDEEDRLRFRKVKILRVEYDDVLVSGGLVAGERVCVSPLQVVVDGMQVKPIDATPPKRVPAVAESAGDATVGAKAEIVEASATKVEPSTAADAVEETKIGAVEKASS